MTGIPTRINLRPALELRSTRTGFTSIDRLFYILFALGSSTAIIVGHYLTPSVTGVGTHQQLGLPGCPTLHFTGYPCPSCGLTTSFAHAARLEFLQSLQVQPFGLVAFFLALVSIPLCLYLITRRTPIDDLIFGPGSNLIMYVLLSLYLGGWIYKIVIISF